MYCIILYNNTPILCSSDFNKASFCMGEMKGLLVNDERSLWYSRIGEFLMSVWDRRKEILYGNGSNGRTNSTPECEANGIYCYGSWEWVNCYYVIILLVCYFIILYYFILFIYFLLYLLFYFIIFLIIFLFFSFIFYF